MCPVMLAPEATCKEVVMQFTRLSSFWVSITLS